VTKRSMLSGVLSVRSPIEPLTGLEGATPGHGIGPLIALEDRLCVLPAPERAEILERRMLQFRGELPAETVPAATAFRRELRQHLAALPQSRTRWRDTGSRGSVGGGKTHSLMTEPARRAALSASRALSVSHVSWAWPILSFSARQRTTCPQFMEPDMEGLRLDRLGHPAQSVDRPT
jgi:hypothetical protein